MKYEPKGNASSAASMSSAFGLVVAAAGARAGFMEGERRLVPTSGEVGEGGREGGWGGRPMSCCNS